MSFLSSFNRFVEKWMPAIAPVSLLIGVVFSGPIGRLAFLVPYIFAFMTFCGGLNSNFRDMADVLHHPIPVLAVFLLVRVAMPLLALGTGNLLFRAEPYFVTGMVLEFVVPTAVVSFMWSTMYGGNASFTLSILLIDTVLAPFTIPLTLRLLAGSAVSMDAGSMMADLMRMVAVPALCAVSLNQVTGGKAKKVLSARLAPFSKMALILVIVINSTRVAPFVKHLTPTLIGVAAAILIVAASGYAIGWGCALLLRQKRDIVVSMVFGVGMKNISAGAVIAAEYFPPEVMFPVMIGTLFQQVLASVFAHFLSQKANTAQEGLAGKP